MIEGRREPPLSFQEIGRRDDGRDEVAHDVDLDLAAFSELGRELRERDVPLAR